ncbi:hypothetical protein FOZ60_007622 [Perkinsus olseni]|uniref:Uncharacterized protein n=1 Tax=Perkinsus olseni TaxID=32597 RepID=A0A7J6PEU7_PEROL|nr:hypothetical protein FOZ60_007622 [Perkinsus olseni]
MMRYFAAVLLEVAIKICYGGPVLEPDALAKTLTMPVHEGFVTVKIDGQEIDLFLDSGYPGLSVMDGDWYEQEYGKGACTRRRAGCYFCPKEHPCDFEREEWFPTSFGDGTSIKSIIRSGSLVLDGQEATSYPFRVSRGASELELFLLGS